MFRRNLKKLVLWCLADECPTVPADARGYAERTWRFTRLLTFIGFAISVTSGVVTLVFLLTIWTVNNKFTERNPNFKFDENFDAIAAAAEVGRLDLVAMVLTFVAVVAAFSIIYGWTAFRSVAIEAAKVETKERVPVELKALMDSDGDRLVGLALQDAELLAKLQVGLTTAGLGDTETASEVEAEPTWTEGGQSDDKGAGTPAAVSPGNSRKRGSPRGKPRPPGGDKR